MIIRDKIKSLTYAQIKELISDYEKFETDGSIGECQLRNLAREITNELGTSNITAWMNIIALECYRKLAHFYMEDTR